MDLAVKGFFFKYSPNIIVYNNINKGGKNY